MTGILYGVGVGPGDPELLTLKALRIVRAAPVIAYLSPVRGDSPVSGEALPGRAASPSFARAIVESHLPLGQKEIAISIPMRVERLPGRTVYDEAAQRIAVQLEAGKDVAVLCEGDPFFYGSFMYLFERLAGRFRTEVVPGISSVMAASAALCRPLAARNDVFTIIPGPLPDVEIAARIEGAQGFAIMKLGRHFARLRALLGELGLTDGCSYLERVSLPGQRILSLSEAQGDAPYFSMILGYRGEEAAMRGAPSFPAEVSA